MKILFKEHFRLLYVINTQITAGKLYRFYSKMLTYICSLNVWNCLGWQWCADLIPWQTARSNAMYVLIVLRTVLLKKKYCLINCFLVRFIARNVSATNDDMKHQYKWVNKFAYYVIYHIAIKFIISIRVSAARSLAEMKYYLISWLAWISFNLFSLRYCFLIAMKSRLKKGFLYSYNARSNVFVHRNQGRGCRRCREWGMHVVARDI